MYEFMHVQLYTYVNVYVHKQNNVYIYKWVNISDICFVFVYLLSLALGGSIAQMQLLFTFYLSFRKGKTYVNQTV